VLIFESRVNGLADCGFNSFAFSLSLADCAWPDTGIVKEKLAKNDARNLRLCSHTCQFL
jgi:hypothetical protein